MSAKLEGEVQIQGSDAAYRRLKTKMEILTALNRKLMEAELAAELADRIAEYREEVAAIERGVSRMWSDASNRRQQVQRTLDEARLKAGNPPSDAQRAAMKRHLEVVELETTAEIATREEALRAYLEEIGPRVDELLGDGHRLLKEANAQKTVENQGRETFEVNRKEFQAGLRHHRIYAAWLLVVMLVLLAALAGAVKLLIVDDLRSPPWVDESTHWIETAVLVLGRFTVVWGLGWLLVFVGKLQGQHSQQAVTYQDRLAGIDAAALVLHYGTDSKVREEMLGRFVEAYISGDANAFRPQKPEPHKRRGESTVKELASELEPLAKAVEPIVKAVSGK